MLSKDIFKNGLKKLVIEFEDKGFKMSPERAEQWFENIKNMSDIEFKQRIQYVLKNCSYIPSMADILKSKIDNRDKRTQEAYLSLEYLKGGIEFD
ncbi:TPA: hypothetical protein PTV74_003922 [Clostridium botulinum]|uniref:hypothetical protein n=1 Tax=Clostridium botulinum TaxID=1491 RepID=UPI000D0CFC71|nr:hypothetical protein [Clostridium botulinum]MBN3348311.1 hypothetical protein [Clostridium botulinum]PSL96317.1 hypothetical protein C6C12_19225 [Clostridium botulinum]HDK7140043.1 hypothetical protein [Clostridium botulinum]HDK7143631.1 hypothetical protein [Clostridium botulinum]HDK7147277.1 hypothetical protein [Clostridium botulinum]